MSFRAVSAITLAALVLNASAANAGGVLRDQWLEQEQATVGQTLSDRLLIVNGNTGHVVYDDGKNNLFCVTRKLVVGYNEWGNPIRKRIMRCR